MAGTCLLTYSTALANSSALHIYVLIALQPARSINVALFQLLEWHKYAMFPVSSGVHAAEEAERCAIQKEAGVSFKTSLSFAWPNLCFPLRSAKMFLTSRRHGSTLETAAGALFWVLRRLMTLSLSWMATKWFLSSASFHAVWTQTLDREDGIQRSQGESTRNVKKRHAPSKGKPQARVCG